MEKEIILTLQAIAWLTVFMLLICKAFFKKKKPDIIIKSLDRRHESHTP